MPALRRSAALLATLCACAGRPPAAAAPPAAPAAASDGAAGAPLVIVLSWDGTRADYPERIATRGLARMQREGVRAERLVPVYPSLTFPNHVALATGAPVDKHGIVANKFTDRAGASLPVKDVASWIEAEPLWIAAERQGVPAAAYFWVGSETDWRGQRAQLRMAPFSEAVTDAEKVKQLLAWLDLPAAARPRLIMEWWHGCDEAGHQLGPDAPEIAEALRDDDDQLAALLEALDQRKLWERTTLLVVSDHGMARVTRPLDVGAALAAAGLKGRVQASCGTAEVTLDDPSQAPAARAALAAALPGARAWTPAERPAALRSYFPGRSGDVLLVTEPPDCLVAKAGDRKLDGRRARGAHGFLPDRPEMGGIFYALGRGVPAGARLPPVRAIDLAPTVAALLGIAPPAQAEGSAVLGGR